MKVTSPEADQQFWYINPFPWLLCQCIWTRHRVLFCVVVDGFPSLPSRESLNTLDNVTLHSKYRQVFHDIKNLLSSIQISEHYLELLSGFQFSLHHVVTKLPSSPPQESVSIIYFRLLAIFSIVCDCVLLL